MKELFKSNQTRCGVFPVYLNSKTKSIFALACTGKKLYFHTKFANFANKEFKKSVFFIGSRSCLNQTKLGMEYPRSDLILKRKEFMLSLAQEKS